MPPIPNAIGISRFDSWLRRVMRLRERSVVPTVATELIPVTGFEMDRIENFLPGETSLVGGAVLAQPGAGEFGGSAFGNPAGSGVLAVVEEVQLSSSAAFSFDFGLVAAAVGTASTPSFKDLRSFPSVPACTITEVSDAAAILVFVGTRYRRFELAAGAGLFFPARIIVPPGFNIGIQTATTGAANIRVGWQWYERALEASEEEGG